MEQNSTTIHSKNKKYTLQELADLLNAVVKGDASITIEGIDTLDEATNQDLSFLANPRYMEAMKKSKAGAICVDSKTPLSASQNYLICDNPSACFQKVMRLFLNEPMITSFSGIHPTAVIHPTANIDPSANIGPYCVVDAQSTIGANTQLISHVTVGYGVTIGNNCIIHANCVIREGCVLENHVSLQPGCIIGSCGFGYIPDATGQYQKLEQLGNVVLQDFVEIGANTCIDRSRFKTTLIKKGSKIDNLCQIAHNVEVGEHNIIAAQTGIAGSSKTGKHVMLGGQVGIVGHVTLEDKVLIATRGGVSKSLKSGTYRGSPAIPIQEYNRQEVFLRKVESLHQKIKELEAKLETKIQN